MSGKLQFVKLTSITNYYVFIMPGLEIYFYSKDKKSKLIYFKSFIYKKKQYFIVSKITTRPIEYFPKFKLVRENAF